MNPVYSMQETHHFPSEKKLKVLVIESQSQVVNSLTDALRSAKVLDVTAACSALESRAKYGEGVKQSADLKRGQAPGQDQERFDIVLINTDGLTVEVALESIQLLADDFKDSYITVIADKYEHRLAELVSSNKIAGVVPDAYNTAQVLNCLYLIFSGVQFVPMEYRSSALETFSTELGAISAKLEEKLTPRQLEVLEYVSLGKSNKYIATKLSLCESTVKVHVHEVMKRLGASSRTHATYLVNTLYRKPESSTTETA